MDAMDSALVGTATVMGNTVAVYDYEAVLKVLTDSGMSRGDAIDFYCFNIECSFVGRFTPVVVDFTSAGHMR